MSIQQCYSLKRRLGPKFRRAMGWLVTDGTDFVCHAPAPDPSAWADFRLAATWAKCQDRHAAVLFRSRRAAGLVAYVFPELTVERVVASTRQPWL